MNSLDYASSSRFPRVHRRIPASPHRDVRNPPLELAVVFLYEEGQVILGHEIEPAGGRFEKRFYDVARFVSTPSPVSYSHLLPPPTTANPVCRSLPEKKNILT